MTLGDNHGACLALNGCRAQGDVQERGGAKLLRLPLLAAAYQSPVLPLTSGMLACEPPAER